MDDDDVDGLLAAVDGLDEDDDEEVSGNKLL